MKTRNEPRTEIGRLLEKERANLGLSMGAFAEVLGTTRPTYQNWRMRPVNIEPDNVDAIAEILGMTDVEVYAILRRDPESAHNPRSVWFARPIDAAVAA